MPASPRNVGGAVLSTPVYLQQVAAVDIPEEARRGSGSSCGMGSDDSHGATEAADDKEQQRADAEAEPEAGPADQQARGEAQAAAAASNSAAKKAAGEFAAQLQLAHFVTAISLYQGFIHFLEVGAALKASPANGFLF